MSVGALLIIKHLSYAILSFRGEGPGGSKRRQFPRGGGFPGGPVTGMDVFWDHTIGLPCMMIYLFYVGKPLVRTDGLRSRDYQNFSYG